MFVESIHNEPRKKQKLIENRLCKAETGLAGREHGVRFQKKEEIKRCVQKALRCRRSKR